MATPRKTTPRKAPRAKAPETLDVTINLDTLEREPGDTPAEPFSFLHDGRRYELLAPDEMDWQDLLLADNNPAMLFAKGLVGDKGVFFTTPMSAWKMKALMRLYRRHFGLPEPGDLAALSR